MVIETLQANLGNPQILQGLREGLVDGLIGMNEFISASGGRVVANIQRAKKQPQKPVRRRR